MVSIIGVVTGVWGDAPLSLGEEIVQPVPRQWEGFEGPTQRFSFLGYNPPPPLLLKEFGAAEAAITKEGGPTVHTTKSQLREYHGRPSIRGEVC